jgi:hypothetical protein
MPKLATKYLRELREEYGLARKALKSQLLDEAVKRTGLARKVIIRKLARPVTLVCRPGPNAGAFTMPLWLPP